MKNRCKYLTNDHQDVEPLIATSKCSVKNDNTSELVTFFKTQKFKEDNVLDILIKLLLASNNTNYEKIFHKSRVESFVSKTENEIVFSIHFAI